MSALIVVAWSLYLMIRGVDDSSFLVLVTPGIRDQFEEPSDYERVVLESK
jgi:hypothetical protein